MEAAPSSGAGAAGRKVAGAPTGSGSGGADREQMEQLQASRTPEDIPDGRDDDIVARQIREAAVKEEDPGLREKLWAEYRTYKGLPPVRSKTAPPPATDKKNGEADPGGKAGREPGGMSP